MSIRQRARGANTYPGQYKSLVLDAIQGVDLAKVSQAIEIFKSARSRGRRIFLCGNSSTESLMSQLLCDLVRRASFNRSSQFRILALIDQTAKLDAHVDETTKDHIFVEQLKNFAEPDDIVMGLCASGDSQSIINAIEYASWIGCRTIGLTGRDGGKLAQLTELNIKVPVTHAGCIADGQLMICQMIGYYFLELEKKS